MNRRTNVLIVSVLLGIIVGLTSDYDWWVGFLAGWGICDIVDTLWPAERRAPQSRPLP